jgi:hypothetical protein
VPKHQFMKVHSGSASEVLFLNVDAGCRRVDSVTCWQSVPCVKELLVPTGKAG